MESYGFKFPKTPIRFKTEDELMEFISHNQYYLKYLYHNYPNIPLIEYFYVSHNRYYHKIAPYNGEMVLYNANKPESLKVQLHGLYESLTEKISFLT